MLGDANVNLNINLHLPGILSVIKIIHGEANKDIKMQMNGHSLCPGTGVSSRRCKGLPLHGGHQPHPRISRVKRRAWAMAEEEAHVPAIKYKKKQKQNPDMTAATALAGHGLHPAFRKTSLLSLNGPNY